VSKQRAFVSQVAPPGSDLEWTDAFSEALRNRGIDVFEFVIRGVEPPENPPIEQVGEALRNSDSIVMVMDPGSINAPEFEFEYGVALGGEKDIVAVVPRGTDPESIELVPLRQYLVERASPAATADAVLARLRQPQIA
jgi:TIR domain